MEQRFTFDQIAGAYRASRPDYPEALVDDVVSYAAMKPGDPVLEVGCGTGQATKSFATRDLQIVAIDPGPEMVRTARESLAGFDNVELVEATFEAWSQDKAPFRLIVAAQSWHWVAPELRFVKAAKLLSPDGSLAVFGHVPTGLPASLLERFKDIYLRHTGRWGPPPEAWYLPSGPFKGWFDESGLFGAVEHRCYPWKWQHTTSSYANFLGTRSEFRMLTPTIREELRNDISKAIDRHGGEFEVDYETHLYMARRIGLGE
ncbi:MULTISPECIES: class I SAM-dependent methyltransferase [unclassified Bradyrhizobium]|uniref:class I SAM-dependent methyltransferase n=1 Tax=unclassified Bradyrhizobium TaxID=2631580 RepID=UPI0020B2A761|nr:MULTISPECIES: class I SAM-dependent methyltransferase [unclassified Bradyrhizobium]MCP3380684.1 class I SAM-dependent methyltransferase [Bradyrhizobium sp. CCGUVB4N]MCP3441557.1 class I SAM-dependent methyltransferase [Bradyrhizobium sp. CCGUVB14]WFU79804.1 class I SAM-dependent methyltransferase [Bradyrhizobium sp. CIAT3101]